MMLADELVGYFGDARVIVNDLLMHVEPAATALDSGEQARFAMREYLRRFDEAFASDCPILTFPAGLCSRRRQGWCPICRGVRISSSGRRRPGAGSCRFSSRANYPISLPPFQFSDEDRYPVQYRDALSARRDVFAEGKTFPDTGRGACFDGRAGRMRIVAAAGGLRTRKGVFFGKSCVPKQNTDKLFSFALNLTAWNPS